jgi:DNA end-binding protein Ku
LRPDVAVNERELAVAGTLVEALQEPFDPARYHDRYREALLELIAGKTQGKQVVVPETETAGQPASDLMAALRASLEAARKRTAGDGLPAPSTAVEDDRKPSGGKSGKAARGRKRAA